MEHNTPLSPILYAKVLGSGGGGGSVTPESVLAATGQMTNEQAGQTLDNLRGLSTDVVSVPTAQEDGRFLKASNDGTASWEPLVHVASPSGSAVALIPDDGWCYKCGELTSLTITDPPSTGSYSIVFTSGSTPTVTTFPATILGLENFAAEANTLYEINVLDNRAVVGSWAVSV